MPTGTSNGQQGQNRGLIPILRPNVVINADEYAVNQNKIAQIRQMAAQMEQTNNEAHRRFVQEELQRRVEEGQRAQQLLASMSQAGNNQATIAPTPASFLSAPSTGHTEHQEQQSGPHIIPSTARIEEVSSTTTSQASQQVGGPSTSTIRASATGPIDQSRRGQPGPNMQPYGGQPYNSVNQPSSNVPKFGGTLQGRWLTQPQPQPQPQRHQPPPPAQLQGQSQWRSQQLSQHQQQQLPQQQQRQTQYAQSSTSALGQFSQPHIPGPMHPAQGSNLPQSVAIPNTSSLDGALGGQASRPSSSSSHRATPAPPVRQNAAVNQNAPQQQHANTQGRQSLDKDAIAADVMQRMGPNYISNMVAAARANTNTAVPKPPTRENRVAATAASQVPASSSSSSQSTEAFVNLESSVSILPAQVRSNTRHIAMQRPNNTSDVPVSTPAASTGSQPPGVSIGTDMAAHGAAPSNTSTSSTQAHVSVSQNAAPAQAQYVTPMNLSFAEGSIQWHSYGPPGNQSQAALQNAFQAGPSRSWITPRNASGISNAPSDSDAHRMAAVGPITPTNQQSQTGISPRTPASADKRHLARDILRSLGASRSLNGKRKRSEEPPTTTKRVRPPLAEQPTTETHALGSISNTQLDSVISGQPLAVDALPVHASASEREDEDEIMLVEDMTLLPPLAGPPQLSNSQAVAISSSAAIQSDEIIDISDDEPQIEKSPAKPTKAVPTVAPASSPFPPAETVLSKAKEPLFLPSPSSSPRSVQSPQYPDNDPVTLGGDGGEIEAPWDMPSMDLLDVSMGQSLFLEPKKQEKKRMEVYVLIPPPPDWVKQAKQSNKFQSRQGNDREQKHNKAKRKAWLPVEEMVGDSEDGIEEIDDWDVKDGRTSGRGPEGEANAERRRQAEAAGREAMSLTSSLLRKQPCKWRYCDVVMNTVDKLSQHVAHHVQNKTEPYICLWQNCIRRFSEESKLLSHLDSHVRFPVPCPYQDCDLAYRTPKDLVTHCRIEHGGDKHRPSPKPFKPTLMDMPPVPTTLPSYMVVPRDIRQTPVSKERHALLGPWVLRNIFGPVSLEVKRQNAAVPLRSVRGVMDKEDLTPQTITNDEYDFLRPKSPSSTPKARFDDIPSVAVSRLVHAGLVFWGPDMKEESDSTDTAKSPDSASRSDPTMDDGGEYEDPQPKAETLTDSLGLSSAPDGETDDRLAAIERRIGQPYNNSGPETHAHSPDETSCLVV